MKVKIGPYRKNKPQKIKVKIDEWDTWSMDHTLATIVLPMLKQLYKTKHGSPMVDLEDVPENLRMTTHPDWDSQLRFEFYNEDKKDDLIHERWDWVMREMIWTFKQIVKDDESKFYDHSKCNKDDEIMEQVVKIVVDTEGLKKYHDRMKNGLRLFGKYYKGLWD